MIAGAEQDRLLTVEELKRTAGDWAGLDDFGRDDFVRPLQIMLDALNDNPLMTAGGRSNMNLFLIMQLIGRLYTEKGWKAAPDCLGNDVSDPLIITGIVRSGTTALHRLLALDPQFQVLEHWLSRVPMPRPPRERWADIREYQLSAGILDGQVREQPILQIAHLMGDPGDAEESQSLMCQTFKAVSFGNMASMPAYDEWFWSADQTDAYLRLADTLRLIGSNEPDKRWLLKNPGDALALEAVFDAFPDARVVQTHRTPLQAIPSLCSLQEGFHALFEGGPTDLARMGRRATREWRLAMERAAAARARIDRPDRFLDIEFHAFRRDPIATAARIYDAFGIALSPEVERRWEKWVDDSKSGPAAAHAYTLERFGLSEAYLTAEFRDYLDRLDHLRDAR